MKLIKHIILCVFFTSLIFASETPYCLAFDDSASYVKIDDGPLNFTTKFTLECWFNVSEFVNNAALIDFTTLGIRNGQYFGYGIFTLDSNRIAIRIGNSSKSYEMDIRDIKTDVWYHLAVTYDKFKNDENVVAFINGRIVQKGDCNIYLEYPDTPYDYGVVLGAFYDYPDIIPFKGQLDDVRFWSDVRTNEEIRNNLQCSVGSDESGLVGNYTFDQDSGFVALDLSPNENDAQLMNMSNDAWRLSYAQLAVTQAYDVSYNRLVLPWISSSLFTSYCVDISEDTSFASSLDGYPLYDVTTEYHIVDNIEPGTYYFRVKGHYDGETTDAEPWTDIQSVSTVSDFSTPIELSYFNASYEHGSVQVDWETASQTENAMFVLEKRSDKLNWHAIYRTSGAGTTSKSESYSYLDKDIVQGGNYTYRLKDVSYAGEIGLSDEKQINIIYDDPVSISPNPFNPSTKISLDFDENADVSLNIYSVSGNLVKTLYEGSLAPGSYSYYWRPDGLSSGIYFIKSTVNSRTISHKLLYIK